MNHRSVPPDSRIVSLTPEQRTPIMFYRPNHPGSIPALKVVLQMSAIVHDRRMLWCSMLIYAAVQNIWCRCWWGNMFDWPYR